jgi:hypothetical protein
MEAVMFWLIRRLPGLLLFLIGLGLCLGWVCLSKPSVDTESNKINFSVSVDTNKLEADADKLKQRLAGQAVTKATEVANEEVTRRINEFGNGAKSQRVR